MRDGSQIFFHLFFCHTDTVIDDGQSSLLHICLKSNIKVVSGQPLRSFVVEFVDRIAGVGNQFSQKDFFICIDRIDHHIQQFF